MRNAATVLGIIRERGRRGLPLEDVYRQLFNPELYLLAYGRIAANQGALTPGATGETADGMSQAKIQRIIGLIRQERYRWTPVRRTYIPKKDGRLRMLGLPTWSDKLLQEVLRLILEAYYEPQFSDNSHGFRRGRGCHTALRAVSRWRGTTWFIEGDISKCFDTIDHTVLMATMREKIHDGRFTRLLADLLKAGYVEDWKYGKTLSGTPQGGIVSPILSNIYLDRLDKFIERQLLPDYNQGANHGKNQAYWQLAGRVSYARRTGRTDQAAQLYKQLQRLPSIDTHDPQYRRLHYVRYADDVLLGFTGPKSEAEEIKQRLGEYLRDVLKLELSESKTLVTHGRTAAARFLGYAISTAQADSKHDRTGKRSINGVIVLRVPKAVLPPKLRRYRKNGKPVHLIERIQDDVYSIVQGYQSEYRGLVEYYRMAINLYRLSTLKYVMEQSLVKTLARKFRTSRSTIYRRYHATRSTPAGPRKVLQARIEREGKRPLIATWGAIDLARNPNAVLKDEPTRVWNRRTEVVERLLADTCELCGSHEQVEVHHIRALKDLKQPGRADRPQWMQTMAARHRKKLVVCHQCHVAITHGQPRQTVTKR